MSRPITKSGYVYIYVSNETPNIYTYWDNLQVTQVRGPLLQEEGYYPFGLEMKAIGSMAALKMQTNYKYNAGTNLESNFNVDYYETPARNYDAQLGRFTGVDAMAEKNNFQSTYQFGNNNPMLFNDPTGLNVWDYNWASEFDPSAPVGPKPDRLPEDGGGGGSFGGGGGSGGGTGNFSDFWNSFFSEADKSIGDNTGSFDFTFTSVDKNGKNGIDIKYGFDLEGTQTNLQDGINSNDPNQAGNANDEVIGSFFLNFNNYHGGADNDPKALYGNFVGPGPEINPYYIPNGKGGFLKPIDMIDYFAQKHDYAYWLANAGGFKGAVFNDEVKGADLALASGASYVLWMSAINATDWITGKRISASEESWALTITVLFASLGTLKYLRD